MAVRVMKKGLAWRRLKQVSWRGLASVSQQAISCTAAVTTDSARDLGLGASVALANAVGDVR